MASPARYRAGAFRWMRAAAFVAGTGLALARAPFYPPPLTLAVAAGIGALGLMSPGLGVAAFVVALSPPLIAADAVAGIAFLVVGLAAVQYLGGDGAKPFTVVLLAFVATTMKLEWAVVAIGGYVLGASEGAVAALVACAAIQAAGVLLGIPAMGATAAGGDTPVIALSEAPRGALSWLIPSLRSAAPLRTLDAFRTATPPAVLLLQPLVWAAGAGAANGVAKRLPPRGPARIALGAVGAAAGAAVVAMGSFALRRLGSEVPPGTLVAAAAGSAAVAAACVAVVETVFPVKPEEAAAPEASVQAEDADVDELLRLIASAEEELAAKHTADSAVMITDMKSFSAMTEEDGSVISAKRIQRHRDLLLPIISAHGGRGKSTGGDGLVASFEDPAEALIASVEMQQALDAHNAMHPGERSIQIRIGVAWGEVVLDKGGRPFIGTALNKAARVMNLADGGEVLASSDLVERAGRRAPETVRRGAYELKNIAGDVEVLEVVWNRPEERAAGA